MIIFFALIKEQLQAGEMEFKIWYVFSLLIRTKSFSNFFDATLYSWGLIPGECQENSIHVGHVIIDGGLDGDRIKKRIPNYKNIFGEDGLINLQQVTDAF